jgi:hypothetical protein
MWWDPNGWSHQAYVCFLGWVKSGKQTGGILGEHLTPRALGRIRLLRDWWVPSGANVWIT